MFAHERLAEGLSPTIGAARVDAMIDLILGTCVNTIGIQFAVPNAVLLRAAVPEAEAATMDPAELIAVEGLSPAGPVQLRRDVLTNLLDSLTEALTGGVTGTKDIDGGVATQSDVAPLTATLVGCDATTGAAATVPVDPTNTPRNTLPRNEIRETPTDAIALDRFTMPEQFSLLEHHIEHVLAEAEQITKQAAEDEAARVAEHVEAMACISREQQQADDPPPY